MLPSTRLAPLRSTARATALTVIGLGAAALTWRLRPSAPSATAAPDADVVLGCAWLAWALAGYLAVAIAATALSHVIAGLGLSSDPLATLAPARLRRLVEKAITLSVAATLLGTSSAATASVAMRHASIGHHGPRPAASGALDWPGLAEPVRPVSRDTPRSPARSAGATSSVNSAPQPHPAPRHHKAHLGLASGGATTSPPPSATSRGDVVVRAGDSLWSIASRHLGPGASAQATAIAWHQWYAANRHVVGDDPDLIFPGQRLRQPANAASSAHNTAPASPTGSTR